MNKIVLCLDMFLIILNVQKGFELGEYAHHMNPS